MTTPTAPADPRLLQNVRETHDCWVVAPYYAEAEGAMEEQWARYIEPLIRGADFTRVLDLAAGHGRNTNKLKDLAKEIYVVDINQTCIDACRQRFAAPGTCRMHFHVNDGTSLSFIPDASLTLVYSWDAAVHFDKRVIRLYVQEFARIMRPGALGFLHHANYGAIAKDPESNWLDNPGWRSTMTRELMQDYCREAGLEVVEQRLLTWAGVPDLDCTTLFRRPL